MKNCIIPKRIKEKLDVIIVASALVGYNVNEEWRPILYVNDDTRTLKIRIHESQQVFGFYDTGKRMFFIDLIFYKNRFINMDCYNFKDDSGHQRKKLSESLIDKELDWMYNWIVNN